MIELGRQWDGNSRKFDFFLAAGGSDYRAYEVLRKAKENGVKISKLLLFDFKERKESGNEKLSIGYERYKSLTYDCIEIKCSVFDPSTCMKNLINNGVDIKVGHTVGIDISCFTKPYYFAILKYLKENACLTSCTVFYTEPLSYIFPKGMYNSYRSSYGPLTVIEVPGFPGVEIGKKKKLLVILLGFEGELSISISEEVAPDDIVLINGFPGYTPKFKDISITNNERIIKTPKAIEYARANNPFETFNLLERLSGDNKESFLNIAPLGTKPMALGACMFAILNPSVRVLYPLPEKYENITTYQCSSSWSYEVPLEISC